MLHILLLILKIIGIILLSLIAFLLLACILILFVPIRYRIKAYRVAETECNYAQAKITWLLHIISVAACYEENQLNDTIRIFGIKLRLNKSKKPAKEKSDTDSSEEQPEAPVKALEETTAEETAAPETAAPETAEPESEADAEAGARTASKSQRQSFFQKCRAGCKAVWDFILNFKQRVKQIYKRLLLTRDNIDYYIAAFQDEQNKKVLAQCLIQLKKILHNIKPRRFKAKLHIGMEEPEALGQLLAVLGIIYPLFQGRIEIDPAFNESVFEGDIYIKGRVTAFVLLKAGIKLYFNKDMKRMIRILKKEAA